MLTKLHISNFILLDNLELDVLNGLTVVTGETGSGKSIIIDALSLVFGSRITSNIAHNADKPVDISAVFSLNNVGAINYLRENDLIDYDDPNSVICRRVVNPSNKTKFYINGHIVTAAQIKLLGELILDIHTQHSAITLLKPDNQRKLLDKYAKVESLVITLNSYYSQIKDLNHKLITATEKSQELLFRQQYLKESIKELKDLNLSANDWEEINKKHKELANCSSIINELSYIESSFNNENTSLISTIHTIAQHLNQIANYTPKIPPLLETINSIEIDLNEFNREIGTLLHSLNPDPQELSRYEAKIEQIFTVSRKYKITPEQIITTITSMEDELTHISSDTNIELLQEEINTLTNKYNELAQQISNKRLSSAKTLSNKVTKQLHTLALTGEFKINCQPLPSPSLNGLETIEYQVSFNKGLSLQPLAKAASGGELSRTALILYLLLSIESTPEIIIFDEIDVGISGKVASHVGQLLSDLGKNKQVICITHQAQTASYGNNHLFVNKTQEKNTTLTSPYYIKDQDRVSEIARMLGGIKITDTTIKHAKEMLYS